jgi:malonyl-CoA O-methyltransferase
MFGRLRAALHRLQPPAVLPVLDAYARWAASYPADAHNPFMCVEQRALLDLLPDVSGAVVLDLGCGTGRYLKIVRARGAAAAVGLDISPHMLRQAVAVTTAVACGDLASLPFRSGAAGIVICGLAVGHLQRLSGAIAEMGRVLKPGGTLLYSDFHPTAHLAGRRRLFEANGREYAVEHHAHLYPVHEAACAAADLDIDAVSEPAGSDGVPAVLVIRARKQKTG